MDPKDFLRETKELKIAKFLGDRSRRAHVVAPKEIIDAVAALNPQFRFSYSHDWRSISGGPDNIFVFDDREGYPSSLLRQRYPSKNVYVINFDIALRLVCREMKLSTWQPEPKYRYCLITTPRTGSTLLAHLLAQLGLGKPIEHVRQPLVYVIKQGNYAFEKVMDGLERIASRNEVFGTKFISTFVYYIFRDEGAPKLADYLNAFGYRVVYLKRNRYEQAVSSYFAARTKLWHLFDGTKFAKKGEVSYDFGAINEIYNRFTDEERFVTEAVGYIPSDRLMTVNYSDLEADPGAIANQVKVLIGADVPDAEISLENAPKKISAQDDRIDDFRLRFEEERRIHG